MTKVLYIPHLKSNLFSVRQAAKHGVVTLFDDDRFVMLDKWCEGEIILEGSL
jgi:hypothetical protein